MNLRRRRHWGIGDVHGCYQPLNKLLATLPLNDHLVFCGDVINRGGVTPATMDLVWDLIQTDRATWLRGNHEHDLIDSLKNELTPSRDGLRQHTTHGQLGDSSARKWLLRLQQFPLVYRGEGWCTTHAGFNAEGPQMERFGRIVLIDTGAVYGGCLSAYCPETDAVVQVQGAKRIPAFPRPLDLNHRPSVAGDAGPC